MEELGQRESPHYLGHSHVTCSCFAHGLIDTYPSGPSSLAGVLTQTDIRALASRAVLQWETHDHNP
jgi:hypothetical protein